VHSPELQTALLRSAMGVCHCCGDIAHASRSAFHMTCADRLPLYGDTRVWIPLVATRLYYAFASLLAPLLHSSRILFCLFPARRFVRYSRYAHSACSVHMTAGGRLCLWDVDVSNACQCVSFHPHSAHMSLSRWTLSAFATCRKCVLHPPGRDTSMTILETSSSCSQSPQHAMKHLCLFSFFLEKRQILILKKTNTRSTRSYLSICTYGTRAAKLSCATQLAASVFYSIHRIYCWRWL
jgi:hypothetical protein